MYFEFCDKCKIIRPKKMYRSDLEYRWYMKVRIRLRKKIFDDVIILARVTCALY